MIEPTEPNIIQIAMMASRIYATGQGSVKWAAQEAIKLWDEIVKQLEKRKQEEKPK